MRKTPAVTFVVTILAALAALLSGMASLASSPSDRTSASPGAPAPEDGEPSGTSEAEGEEELEETTFTMSPGNINGDSSGKYITARMALPEGRTVRDVVIPSVRLNGIVYASTSFGPHNPVVEFDNKDTLMLKFDREWVQEILSPGTNVPVWLYGAFADGAHFIAWGEVSVGS